MLILDSHNSRLHPECMAKAEELGFDVLLLPGGLTAFLQLMDQLFGEQKAWFTRLRAVACAAGGWRQLTRPQQLKQWVEAKKRWVAASTAERVKKAAKDIGIWPACKETALANLRKQTARDPQPPEGVKHADFTQLGPNVATVTGHRAMVDMVLFDAKQAAADADPSIVKVKGSAMPYPTMHFSRGSSWRAVREAKAAGGKTTGGGRRRKATEAFGDGAAAAAGAGSGLASPSAAGSARGAGATKRAKALPAKRPTYIGGTGGPSRLLAAPAKAPSVDEVLPPRQRVGVDTCVAKGLDKEVRPPT